MPKLLLCSVSKSAIKPNIMKVSLKKAFSLLDGRLSTEIGDVYEMLNYIFDENFMAHQLPTAMRKLQEVNPKWFSDAVSIINDIKRTNQTDDFVELMNLIDNGFPTFEIESGKLKADIPFLAGLV
jgi:hypothetical protein